MRSGTGRPGGCRRRAPSVPLVSAAILVLLSPVPGPVPAEANGGTLRLDRVRTGPYLVSLWTQPTPPSPGRLDVSLAVRQPPSDEAVLDVRARLSAASTEPRTTSTVALSVGRGRNPLLYHGNLELPSPGVWRVTLVVEGSAGEGRVDFDLEVRPPTPLDWRLLAIALLLVPVAAWWTMVRARPARIEEGVTDDESRRDGPNGSVRP